MEIRIQDKNFHTEPREAQAGELRLSQIIREAQLHLRAGLERVEFSGGLTRDCYVRFLSMQYHLTRGVQRPFLIAAAHPDLGRMRSLRKFLVNFANEEEFHFEIAAKDLADLNAEPSSMPLEVAVWWAYFDQVVESRPFLRLGATCILENIAEGSQDVIARLMASTDYLTPRNTLFFRIHMHGENLPHGAQILDALRLGGLTSTHWEDVRYGAELATKLYLRMMHWVFTGQETMGMFTPGSSLFQSGLSRHSTGSESG